MLGHPPHNYMQKLTQIKDLNVKAKTITLLKENIMVNLPNPRYDNGFLDVTPKAQQQQQQK